MKFDRGNIDGQHLRPPVLAILLETIERENFDVANLLPNLSFSPVKISRYTVILVILHLVPFRDLQSGQQIPLAGVSLK